MRRLAIASILLFCVVFAARNTPENKAWNVNMNTKFDPLNYYGEWPGHKYYPSPNDWREESFYQFITDRFGDGNPSNNEGRYGGYDLGKVDYRHGGDYVGIKNKLDYIKALGYTTIWVSPVFQNQFNSYHAYAQVDFTVLDDRFGTLEEFRDMVNEAHKRGIKVIVDIVANHMANLLYFEGHEHDGAPFRLHDGEYHLYPRDPNNVYQDFLVNNTFFNDGQYCTLYGYDGLPKHDTGKGSYWYSDFHHNGDLSDYGDVYQNHLGKIYGIMDDLRTTHPRVQDKIIAMTKSLIASVDIDGIRMDTPMQVPLEFFQRWAPAVKNYAKKLGKDNFYIVGEFFCPKERSSTMTGRGKSPNMYGKDQYIGKVATMDAGINYPIYWWFETAIKKSDTKTLSGIKDSFDDDLIKYYWANPNRNNQPQYRHLNFYNNHDQFRMSTIDDGFQRSDLSSAIISLFPGIPSFYYGDEQGFKTMGTALDGWGREDMSTSLAWKDLPTVEGRNPCETDNFDYCHSQFKWNAKLMNLRRLYKNLRSCDQVLERWRQSQNGNGIYAFSRSCGAADQHVLVVWNTWRETLEAGGSIGKFITGWNQGDTIVNVLSDDMKESYDLQGEGSIGYLKVPGYGVKVFVKKSMVKGLDPAVDRIHPKHDSVVEANDLSTVSIRFNVDVAMDSVVDSIYVNKKKVNNVRIVSPRSVELDARPFVKQGVNFINLDGARSTFGTSMFGAFQSRFRVGKQDNVIINPKATFDAGMVVRREGGDVVVRHKAVGAELMRSKVGDGKWSDWSQFKNETRIGASGANKITYQYWVDNSAAYYVWTQF